MKLKNPNLKIVAFNPEIRAEPELGEVLQGVADTIDQVLEQAHEFNTLCFFGIDKEGHFRIQGPAHLVTPHMLRLTAVCFEEEAVRKENPTPPSTTKGVV